MQGAESARVVLEHLFASVRIVSVDRVAQILASHRSTVRPADDDHPAVPLDRVPAALLLLLTRSSGCLIEGRRLASFGQAVLDGAHPDGQRIVISMTKFVTETKHLPDTFQDTHHLVPQCCSHR